MTDVLVVNSKVKERIKSLGLNTAHDAAEGLSEVVSRLIDRAADRAKGNGRKTVRAIDF